MSEFRLSPRAYALLTMLVPLPFIAVLALGNLQVLSGFRLNPFLLVAALSCSAIILALTLRVAMPHLLLARGSVVLLLPIVLGVLMNMIGLSVGQFGIVWASLLLTYLGMGAYLGGGRFAAYLTPSVALVGALPVFALLSAWSAYIVALSILSLAGFLAIVTLKFRARRQRGCEYCLGYFESNSVFCDYCGRRLSGLLKIQAPKKRLFGLLVAGLFLVTLSFSGLSSAGSLLGFGLGQTGTQVLLIAGTGGSSVGGGFGFLGSNSQYSLVASGLLVFGTAAGMARTADMKSAKRFDASFGLDEFEVARLASFAPKGRFTGAELLGTTRFPGGWMALSLLLEKLVRLGLLEREIIVRNGTQTMLWKNNLPS
jgi:hypothetical protein